MSIPTCPWCGNHDRASEVRLPEGRYLCGCNSLFEGTEAEWHRLAQRRREAIERRAKSHNHHVIEESE